ncbi:hypothetical protein LTR08_001295 [Meristemomyces frigidus]|nr:hypothetical protein LTR08_001295 [Meristemomyces frigidus]
MHSQQWRNHHSNRWQAPAYTSRRGNLQLNAARRKVCPNSPFFPENFDVAQHKADWREGEQRRAQLPVKERIELAATDKHRWDVGLPAVTIPRLPKAFNGWEFERRHGDKIKIFDAPRGMVLSYETIFCPHFEDADKEVAPWPSKHEMDYEGDGRMKTDKLHRRFPALPRVGGDQSINWQHRVPIPASPFEEYYYPIPSEVDIFMRMHNVEDAQFDDSVGEQAIGAELMALLDPEDQW